MGIAWVIIIAATVIMVQSYLYHKWGFARVNYQRSFSEQTVFAGEEIQMVDQVSNHKLLPLPWLRLESKIPANLVFQKNSNKETEVEDEIFHRTLFSLLPFQKITRRHQLVCEKRGYYQLSTVSVTMGDLFGFAQQLRIMEAKTAVTVYPKVAAIEEIPFPTHSWLGDISVRRWIMEDPFMPAGVRDYTGGDPLSSINWKATARAGNFQVNQKDYTADPHLMIYLNFDQTEDIWLPIENEALLEKGLSYAASITDYLIARGIRTGFGCNAYFVEPFSDSTEIIKKSVRIEPDNSKQQLTFILDAMAKLKMDRSRSFQSFLMQDIKAQRTNTDILIITAIMTEKLQHYIQELETLGNAVEIIRLPAEPGRAEAGDGYAS